VNRIAFRFAILACCLALAACGGGAQEDRAAQILAQAYDRYAQAKDYEANIALEYDILGKKLSMPVRLAYRRPDGLFFDFGGIPAMTIVRNGKTRWVSIGAPANQYVRQTVKPGESSFGEYQRSLLVVLGGAPKALDLLEGKSLSAGLVRPRLLPDAVVDEHDCYVVALPAALSRGGALKAEAKYYLDKKDLVLRLVETTMTMPQTAGMARGGQVIFRQKYSDISVDAGLPEETFVLKPPQDAKPGARFGSPTESASLLAGKPAPDFSVKTMAGQRVALSDYKGKVLLLHFWASWCGPCRREMPDLEMIYKLAKDKGADFLGISVDSKVADAKKFLGGERIALPAAFDPSGFDGAAKRYKVDAIPSTFVIDRKGVVVRVFIGMSEPEDVVEALKVVGVEVRLPPSEPSPSEVKRQQADGYRERAYRAFLLGQNEEAGRQLRMLTEIEPSDQDAWLTLAEFLFKTSQPAGDALKRALQVAKPSADVHARAALLLLEAGAEPKFALEQAREAVRLQPDSVQYLKVLGWACLQNDLFDEAITNLEKALKLAPGDALDQYRLGQAYDKQGNKQEALRKYRVALNLDPSLQEAKAALDRLAPSGP